MPAAWGKRTEESFHHLAHHCADVAACLTGLAATPVIRARLERAAGRALDERDMARLAMIAFLHDAGKLHPGFQARGWADADWPRFKHGHVSEGLVLLFDRPPGKLRPVAAALHFDRLDDWDETGALRFAAICHHGRPADCNEAARQRWDDRAGNGYDALNAAQEIGALLTDWFAPAFTEGGKCLPDTPEFQHLFCGLMVLADWLGSNRDIFTFVPDLRQDYYRAIALPGARRAIAGIGLDTASWRAAMADSGNFQTIAPGRQPRPMQTLVGEWPTDERLIILEAETGSGKTEAALWRFARLFAEGKVDGLYFAVPTRSAARQLHARVNAAMASIFGPDAPQAVLAVPGYLQAGMAQGQPLPDFRVLWEDKPDEATLLARWAAENSKRYLAAPVAVGTVDQAMLAALRVKHAHLRAASLARSLLVIDEVHASDRYMREVQSQLLANHLGWGGHAMLMSATLGSSARVRWLSGCRSMPPDLHEAIDAPYPAVWGHGGQVRAARGDALLQKHVAMTLAKGWDADTAARLAIAEAKRGGKVLVIRNTVTDAIACFDAVQAQGGGAWLWQVKGGPALHHSRFAAEDRTLLDREVECALSPDPAIRPEGGMIVIGTQTLEQSLDIDADVLMTDLCPVDILLQRIGRLHRHALSRPDGFETPRCLVLAPEDGLDSLAAPKFANGLGAWKAEDGVRGVYINLHCCELTRRLIVEHGEWRIPEMNRFLVESATHDETIAALSEEKGAVWADYWNQLAGKDMAEGLAGGHVALKTDEPMLKDDGDPKLFSGDEEAIRTRLGTEGARIALPAGTIGPFGAEISVITLPAHWANWMDKDADVEVEKDQNDGNIVIKIGKTNIDYSRHGLKK